MALGRRKEREREREREEGRKKLTPASEGGSLSSVVLFMKAKRKKSGRGGVMPN